MYDYYKILRKMRQTQKWCPQTIWHEELVKKLTAWESQQILIAALCKNVIYRQKKLTKCKINDIFYCANIKI